MLKLRSLVAVVVATGLAAPAAFAEFSIDELVDATKVALKEFKKSNPDHVAHFTGYKSWKSGQDSKVKVYVAHDGMNMEFNFVCHKHGTEIECHDQ